MRLWGSSFSSFYWFAFKSQVTGKGVAVVVMLLSAHLGYSYE